MSTIASTRDSTPEVNNTVDASATLSQTAEASLPRDRRIDFYRGLALLVMAVDHAELLSGVQVLSYLTYAPIGISTAAEVFIFLSGYTLGLAFQKVYLNRGYTLLHVRCISRAWQLYVMHILCLALCVLAVGCLPALLGTEVRDASVARSLVIDNEVFAQFALLGSTPPFFDILPLYIIFLLFLPPLFPILNRSTALGLGVPAIIYLTVHALSFSGAVQRPLFLEHLYYQPVAWQLLFSIGMALGIRKRMGARAAVVSVKVIWWLVGMLCVLGLWYKLARLNVLFGWSGAGPYTHGASIPFDVPGIDKPSLGIVRLLHFLVAAKVAQQLLPKECSLWSWPGVGVIETCGRNSLEVFVAGVVFNYAGATIMASLGGGRTMMVAIDGMTILASVGVACLVDWRKSSPWQ